MNLKQKFPQVFAKVVQGLGSLSQNVNTDYQKQLFSVLRIEEVEQLKGVYDNDYEKGLRKIMKPKRRKKLKQQQQQQHIKKTQMQMNEEINWIWLNWL